MHPPPPSPPPQPLVPSRGILRLRLQSIRISRMPSRSGMLVIAWGRGRVQETRGSGEGWGVGGGGGLPEHHRIACGCNELCMAACVPSRASNRVCPREQATDLFPCVYIRVLQSYNNPRPANSAAIRLNLSYQGLGTEYQAIFPALPCHTATSTSTAALACNRWTQMHLV